ncbi:MULTISPECIES: hypothetical protein [unclassified Actinomyces]|uniref:hypothetical protein n=1 Tax=unclassified Actinomyces TaxID=2609248 RepID=UPI002016C2E4|nr:MULTISPECIES: hypothetical protein [unclassified Actinomyces]MCL3777409.1 hypothetical protein [Actinomyces sp. AC-20-1]MCL3789069.1 hypothetical protein [Actinomyces sp. 187325]MCL3792800.1 hypothetical protein [Actinomyces sp. 186855]MCL3793870.1 hypothetical protein [Actinomyces sp. 217892]
MTTTAQPGLRRLSVAPDGAPDAEVLPTGAVLVTPHNRDAEYDTVVIESEEDLPARFDAAGLITQPLHLVRARIEGTPSRFNVYLPPARAWQGRFFQYTYPMDDENVSERKLAFGIDAGGYTVQASGLGGYRHAATAARAGRRIAAELYGLDVEEATTGAAMIPGYLYGPSGGSYQTMGGVESTRGVWQGFVPTVMGTPVSLPSNFLIRGLARLVLDEVAATIRGNVLDGRDPADGLNPLQAEVLAEVTALGLPLPAWARPDYVLGHTDRDGRPTSQSLTDFQGAVASMDPGYAEDFWTRPGYEGCEESPMGALLRSRLVDHDATVVRVLRDGGEDGGEPGRPLGLVVGGLPAQATLADNLDLRMPDGEVLPVHTPRPAETAVTEAAEAAGGLADGEVVLVPAAPAPGTAPAASSGLAALTTGTTVHLDNRLDLAVRLHHRHVVPPAEEGYDAYDCLRGDDGEPLRPQRALRVPWMMAIGVTGGTVYSGHPDGRVMLVSSHEDADAYTWHADWYRRRVEAALGAEAAGRSLRVYVTEHADHHDMPVAPGKDDWLVWYDVAVEQALRDLAAWVEEGVEPPASTGYRVEGGQVILSDGGDRHGQQPLVSLAPAGSDPVAGAAAGRADGLRPGQVARVEVPADADAELVAVATAATVPAGVGRVVEAAWRLAGEQGWHPLAVEPGERVRIPLTVPGSLLKTGTEPMVVVRVASSRGGADDLTRLENLAHLRLAAV